MYTDANKTKKKIGLLLGAGFSYDLGMPLGSEFTKLFFQFLNEKKMEEILQIAESWRPYGEERPLDKKTLDQIREIHSDFIKNGSNNYEDFFRTLEDQEAKNHERTVHDTYSAIIGKLKTLVNEAFWICQQNTYPQYLVNVNLYERFLKELTHEELWIFSLNHDLIIEMLCIDLGILLKMGANEKIDYPWSNQNPDRIMTFGAWDAAEKDVNNLNFLRGVKGVNLIKLHGGINEFIHGDDVSNPRRSLVIAPKECTSSKQYLQYVGSLLHEDHYYYVGSPVRIGGEIAFSDTARKMNFLRPTVLTGGHKYHQTLNSRRHEEKMDLFSSGLAQIDELYIIGYSFGDSHINHRIEHAMHLNEKMSVWEISPGDSNYKGFEPFDYDLRVRKIKTGFSIAAGYIINQKWDNAVEEQLGKNKSLRELLYQGMEKQVFTRP